MNTAAPQPAAAGWDKVKIRLPLPSIHCKSLYMSNKHRDTFKLWQGGERQSLCNNENVWTRRSPAVKEKEIKQMVCFSRKHNKLKILVCFTRGSFCKSSLKIQVHHYSLCQGSAEEASSQMTSSLL